MINSKQRAYLRSLANTMDPIFNIGKGALSMELEDGVLEALEKRELIKVAVLKNCMEDPKALAKELAKATNSDVVQVIGKKITLYKKNYENPKIELPKEKA